MHLDNLSFASFSRVIYATKRTIDCEKDLKVLFSSQTTIKKRPLVATTEKNKGSRGSNS